MKVLRYPPVQPHAALGSSRCSVLIRGDVLIYKIINTDHWNVRKTMFSQPHRVNSFKEAVTWLRLIG